MVLAKVYLFNINKLQTSDRQHVGEFRICNIGWNACLTPTTASTQIHVGTAYNIFQRYYLVTE
jgi:hypothetical protein